MSADNWTVCPKCVKNFRDAREVAIAAVRKKYGKLTPEDYEEEMEGAMGVRSTTPEQTLREDYEMGTDETGRFEVSYGCLCTKCGFRFGFKESRDVLKPSATETDGAK